MSNPYSRISAPRGFAAAIAISLAIAWGPYVLLPGSGLTAPLVQTAVYTGLAALTVLSRRRKVRVVRALQRRVINPVVRGLLHCGVNPLGLAILETRGRRSGLPRHTPVGNGRSGDELWIIAEHGERAGYVRNLRADPAVRVRLRVGLGYRWVDGIATVRADVDPLAVQRRIIRWHPLRAFNALNVRTLGVDLLAVHVQLELPARDGVLSRFSRTPGSVV